MLKDAPQKTAPLVTEQNLDAYKQAYDNQEIIFNKIDNRLMLNFAIERTLIHATGDSVLELGIGHQYTIKPLLERFQRYVVIEGSTQMIDAARKEYAETHVEFEHSFFETFTSSEKFDAIVMGFVLEHVDNPAAILNHYKQFLNESGSIFISVPNCEALNRRFGFHAGMIDNLFELSPFDIAVGHQHAFTLETLTDLVHDCGYRIKCAEGLFMKPMSTQQIIDYKISEEILRAMLVTGINYPELCVGMMMEIAI